MVLIIKLKWSLFFKKIWKTIIILGIGDCFLFWLLACSPVSQVFVSSVHDGDTFKDQKNHAYRLFGVDTPELTDQFHNFRPTTGLQGLYAHEAKKFVFQLIWHKNVEIDVIKTDKYNRQVVTLTINKQDLAILLLKSGLARMAYISVQQQNPFYTKKYQYYDQLTHAQYYAFKNLKGFWRHKTKLSLIFPKANWK